MGEANGIVSPKCVGKRAQAEKKTKTPLTTPQTCGIINNVKWRETLQRTAETVKSTETNLKIGSEKFFKEI